MKVDLDHPKFAKWRHDPETGRARARDEVAAAMAEDEINLGVIRKVLAYPSLIVAKEAINRGRRYSRHLEMARMRTARRRDRMRRGVKTRTNVWTEAAEQLLREKYPDKSIDLHDLAEELTKLADGVITRASVIGKAYRLELKRGFVPKRRTQKAYFENLEKQTGAEA